jgi:hypothetical protein
MKSQKMLVSTWAIKRKVEGQYRVRMNTRPSVHFNINNIAAPLVRETAINRGGTACNGKNHSNNCGYIRRFFTRSFKFRESSYMDIP